MDEESNRKYFKKLFTSTVSFTGGNRLVSKNRVKSRLWLVLIILALVALSYHLSTVVKEYLRYPVNTSQKQKLFRFWFPDVTICLALPFNNKKMPPEDIGLDKGKRFWNYARKYETDLLSQRQAFKNTMDSFQQFADEEDIYTSILDNIHYCSYLGVPCSRNYFAVTRHPLRLNCVTFYPPTRRISIPDKNAGLQLILGSEESYTFFDSTDELFLTHGYEVSIHEPYTMPPVTKRSVPVVPGTHSIIKLRLRSYRKVNTPTHYCYTRKDVINLFKANFQQYFSADEMAKLTFAERYTEDDCYDLLSQFMSLYQCNCLQDRVPFIWGSSINLTRCHAIPREFFYNDGIDSNGILRYKNLSMDLKKNEEFNNILKRVECSENLIDYSSNYDSIVSTMSSCPERCKKRKYSQEVISYDWPQSIHDLRSTLMQFHNSNLSFNSNNNLNLNENLDYLSSVLIYASQLTITETDESLAYPVSQLLADFGGNIGLWIGCSILTLVEVGEFFIRAFIKLIDNRRKRKANEKQITIEAE